MAATISALPQYHGHVMPATELSSLLPSLQIFCFFFATESYRIAYGALCVVGPHFSPKDSSLSNKDFTLNWPFFWLLFCHFGGQEMQTLGSRVQTLECHSIFSGLTGKPYIWKRWCRSLASRCTVPVWLTCGDSQQKNPNHMMKVCCITTAMKL